jgi:RHS repeat-associated protein
VRFGASIVAWHPRSEAEGTLSAHSTSPFASWATAPPPRTVCSSCSATTSAARARWSRLRVRRWASCGIAQHPEARDKAFGEARSASGTVATDYRYTGQREEAGIGLYFYNARWYDPYLNRWIQPDPIVPNPLSPADWNRYAYVRDNPLKYIDPSGLKPCDGEIFDTCGKTQPSTGGGNGSMWGGRNGGGGDDDEEDESGGGSDNTDSRRHKASAPLSLGVCWGTFCTGGADYAHWWWNWYLPRMPGFFASDLRSISAFMTDAGLVVSSLGAGLEIGLTSAGFLLGELVGGGGPAGAAAGWKAGNMVYSTSLNYADTGLGVGAAATSLVADLVESVSHAADAGLVVTLSDSTVTSLATGFSGAVIPSGVADAVIDAYASGALHGHFLGVLGLTGNRDVLLSGGPFTIALGH